MGKIYDSKVKRVGEKILALYSHELSTDFYQNKKLISSIVNTNSKFLINKITGYVTSQVKKKVVAKEEENNESEEAENEKAE
ncbi:MAG: 30S ribosomal protein S17e [Thermoproteota archaeon]|nr:30S ribosomal protein S17e [Candidatus Brockarchaeota archaeon]MBO3768593.1 30S ribosomal protein S17e [Candidatus Brockarchaeota archaeon]MBO3800969.1 30S ribosomal protein S17e [Candidatus Brockarchaeota archaeon]